MLRVTEQSPLVWNSVSAPPIFEFSEWLSPENSLRVRLTGDLSHARSDGWDGDSALAVTDHAIGLTAKLVSGYAGLENVVEISPRPTGSITIVWDDQCGNYVYLDVGPDDTVHLYYDVVGQAKWEDAAVESDPRIREHLVKAFGFQSSRRVAIDAIIFRAAGRETIAGGITVPVE